MSRVVLTKEEAQWFSRNVLKTIGYFENVAKRDASVLEQSSYKALKALEVLADGAGKAQQDTVEIPMSRKQRLVIRELIETVNTRLRDKILPEYERRGGHEKYIEDGKKKVQQLAAMARKFR